MMILKEVKCPKTEDEWFASVDPAELLSFPVNDRKLWLFACACCRSIWHLLRDERSRKAIEVVERYADAKATAEELAQARQSAATVPVGLETRDWNAINAVVGATNQDADRAARFSSSACAIAWADANIAISRDHALAVANKRHAAILRDIIGNPFRQVSVDHSLLTWNAGFIRKVAEKFYEERNIEDICSLATALTDAGCNNLDLIEHCREPVHVRGCWVVDLILSTDR